MDSAENQNEKAKQTTQKANKKKAVDKGDDKLFLLGNINSNVNVFSQLSSMYQKNKDLEPDDETNDQSTTNNKVSTTKNLATTFIEPKNFDFEINKVLGKINKKSDTTKYKAIMELRSVLEKRNEDFYAEFFSTWLYIYKQLLSSEYDKKILEECNTIFNLLAIKLKKKLSPYLKEIFPSWFLSMNDPNQEISSIARKTFDTLFPKEKQAQVLTLCQDEFLTHVLYTLQLSPKKILEESTILTEAQANEIFDRLVVSGFNALSNAFQLNSKNTKPEDFIDRFLNKFGLNQKLTNKNEIIIHLRNNKHPKVRASSISFIKNLINHAGYQKLEENFVILTEYLLDLLDDKDRIVQRALWTETLTNILAIFCEKKTGKIDVIKYQKKTFECLKNCGYGIGSALYNSLVEFFSYITQFVGTNLEKYKEAYQEKITFFKAFFDNILLGFQHEEIKFFGDSLIGSYFECALFCTLKRILPLLDDINNRVNNPNEKKQFINQIKLLIKDIYMNPILEYVKNFINTSTLSPFRNIPLKVTEIFDHLGNEYDRSLFEEFEKVFRTQAQNYMKNLLQFENFLNVMKSLLALKQESVLFEFMKQFTLEMQKNITEMIITSFLDDKIQLNDNLIEKNLEVLQKAVRFFSIFKLKDIRVIDVRELVNVSLEIVENLMKKYLTSLGNIIKISNAEKFCSNIIKIFNDIRYIVQISSKSEGDNYMPQKLLDIYDIFISIFNSGVMMNDIELTIFIPLIYMISPYCPDNYFAEYLGYNGNRQSENFLIVKIIDISNVKKDRDEIATISQFNEIATTNPKFQKLVSLFSIKIFNSDKFKIFSPFISHAMLLCNNEESNDTFIEVINNFLKDITNNKTKINLYFDKIDLIFAIFINIIKKQNHQIIVSPNYKKSLINSFTYLLNILFNIYKFGGNQVTKRTQIIYEILNKLPNEAGISQSSLKPIKEEIFSIHTSLINKLIWEIMDVNNPQKEENGMDNNQLLMMMRIIEDFTRFNITNKNPSYVISLVKSILHEDLFRNCLVSPGIWMILKKCLENSKAILDYKEAFNLKNVEDIKEERFWLILNLISVTNSNSLFMNLKEKRFYIELSNNYILPLLIKALEDKTLDCYNKTIKFIEYAFEKAENVSLIYSMGLRVLLKTYITDIIDDVTVMKIYQKVIEYPVNNTITTTKDIILGKTELSSEFLFKRAIINKNLISVFTKFIVDQKCDFTPFLDQIYENLIMISQSINISSDILTVYLVNIDIYCALLSQSAAGSLENIKIDDIIKFVFKEFNIKFLEKNALNPNFAINTIFEFINLIIEYKTFEPLTANILDIEQLFMFGIDYTHAAQKYSSNALIRINMFMRKVLPYMEIFSDGFKEKALNGLLKLCKLKNNELISVYKSKLEENNMTNELNEAMVTEFAETITRISITVDQNIDENTLYELLDCEMQAIQKSSFLLLKNLYYNFGIKTMPNIEEEKIEDPKYLSDIFQTQKILPNSLIKYLHNFEVGHKNISNDEIKEDEEEEEDIQEVDYLKPSNYGFILSWIALILKMKIQLGNSANNIETLIRKLIITYLQQNKQLYIKALNIIFEWLKELDMTEVEQKRIIAPKTKNIASICPETFDFLQDENFFRIILYLIYLFAGRFPNFFRKWFTDANKTFQKLAESCIKNFISTSLFLDEREYIENRIQEWKSDEFQIYLATSTRQITAIYTKEGSKVEIVLQVPEDYPLNLVNISSERKIKIEEAKLKRWTVLMHSILINENNNILTALMIWKKNLDKEFEGVEECAICYYVIHGSTRELPKFPCKTCKHKFHSTCIQKWFASSNKSECPLCKSQFL